VPHITTRKVTVSIQDFCNLLGGGLVSLSTIHADTLAVIGSMSSGAVICVYKYNPADVLERVKEEAVEEEEVYETPVIFADIPEKKSKKQAAREAEAAAKAEVAAKDESGTSFSCYSDPKLLQCTQFFPRWLSQHMTPLCYFPFHSRWTSLLRYVLERRHAHHECDVRKDGDREHEAPVVSSRCPPS
jgi:hypothetical protein